MRFVFLLFWASGALAVDAVDLLQASDRARGGLASGAKWTVAIESLENGESTQRAFAITARGVDALARAIEPARNRGELFLFNDRTIWFFKPGLRKPVAISAKQKLSGQVSNGDIATTNYARDYEPKSTGEERVQGESCWILDLKAKSSSTTYDRIRYWVSKSRKLAIQAEFQTPEGKPLKKAVFQYKNEIQSKGKKTPFVSRMEIVDALVPGNKSVLVYDKPKVEDVSDSVFNVNSLMR